MEFIKYLIAGLVNTCVGYGVYFASTNWLGLSPYFSNAIGYLIALVIAFLLNKKFVFDETDFKYSMAAKFLTSFVIAFTINQVVLLIFFSWLGWTSEMAQIPAMISYTLVFYLLNKKVVFIGSVDNDS